MGKGVGRAGWQNSGQGRKGWAAQMGQQRLSGAVLSLLAGNPRRLSQYRKSSPGLAARNAGCSCTFGRSPSARYRQLYSLASVGRARPCKQWGLSGKGVGKGASA